MTKFKVGDRVRPSAAFYRSFFGSRSATAIITNRALVGTVSEVYDHGLKGKFAVKWPLYLFSDGTVVPAVWGASSLELITGLDIMLEVSFGGE